MRCHSTLVFFAAISIAVPTELAAGTVIRIASWNIANFHHEVGIELREGIGTRRKETDFLTLKRYADSLNADIVALQEIGTKEAAELLFPSSKFEVFMESRYAEDIQNGPSKDVYTAVAVRKRSDTRVLEQKDLVDLQLEEIDDDGQNHYTRRGAALKLEVSGTPLWFVSLHLKSSCSSTKRADQSTDSDCMLFWQQRLPLKAFIDQRIADGTVFIFAGDFNRRFRQFQFQDPMWAYLNGENLERPLLTAHPEAETRKCPTKKGASTQPIDWLVVDARVSRWVRPESYWETRYSFEDAEAAGGTSSDRLSDHCPIRIDLVVQ